MTKRPYGEQSAFQKQLEADSARAAQFSPMERWTTAEVQRNRRGESDYIYPPDDFAAQPSQGERHNSEPSPGTWRDLNGVKRAQKQARADSGGGGGGPLAGFLRALDLG